MSDVRERSIARLSLAAFAVDAMVVTLFIAGGHELLRFYVHPPAHWMFVVIVPIVLVLHFLIVELVFGGRSIGRLSTGLTMRDETTGAAPQMSSRAIRCTSVIMSLGLPSLHPGRLPKYSKNVDRCLCSDWAGSITLKEGQPRPASPTRKHAPKSANLNARQIGVRVVEGADEGRFTRLAQGRAFAKDGIFVIGRDKEHSDLIIRNDGMISGIHCRLAFKDNQCLIVDGQNARDPSKNGTFVNNRKISHQKATRVQLGDRIKIGNTILQVEQR